MPLNSSVLLTIIIPFYHEEANITKTLNSLEQEVSVHHETLLIYDDREDPTIPIIKGIQAKYPSIELLPNKLNPGIPGAIKTGMDVARGKYILFLVADDQGPISIISPMIDLMNQGYAMVSATRYAKGGKVSGRQSFARALSDWGNRLFCALSASPFSDATCGIKMFRKDILQRIKLKADSGWTIAFELAIEAQYYDLKVTEIGFSSYNRINGGKSRFSTGSRLFAYGKIMLWGILKSWKK